MRLTPTEIKILELFIKDISLELSINAISKRLDKHYRVIRVNVLSLIKKKVIKSRDIAGAKAISLNLKSPNFPSYMAYIEEVYAYEKVFDHLPQISDMIIKAREISPTFCIGVFGSYADNSQKKGSDMDIFLISAKEDVKKYASLIRQFPSIEDMIDWNVFSADEFKKGIKAKGTFVYKEIVKNKLIIKGADLFYNIIAEAGKIEED